MHYPLKWVLIVLMQFFALSFNAHAISTSIPQHNTRVTYDFDASQSIAYNYDYFITFNGPNSTRNGLGLYSQFSFGFQAGPIGYLGLQKEFNRHKVIFSIWDASSTSMTALPAVSDSCARFGHEGSGTMCISEYNWIPDREYRLRLWNLGSNSQATGQTWWVGIQDTVTKIETHVGSILLLNTNGFQGYGYLEAKYGSPGTINEYYGGTGQNVECGDLPLFSVTNRGPYANNNDYTGVRTPPVGARVNYRGFGVGTDCPNNNVSSNSPHAVTITTGANTQRITPDDSNVWSKLSQTIDFNLTGSIQVGETRTLSAQASSGLSLSFSVAPNNGVCSLTGAVVTGISQGVCTVFADQAGNATYEPAPQAARSISVQATTVSQPPFSETAFVEPNILVNTDPGVYGSVVFRGQGVRTVFDRRTNRFAATDVYIFEAIGADGSVLEALINLEFGSVGSAGAEAQRYARLCGQLPWASRRNLKRFMVHKGDHDFDGDREGTLTIHSGRAISYDANGALEEVLVQQAAHVSMDERHELAPAWLAAQVADGGFVSTYARDYPTRQDVAESYLMYLAVRDSSGRVSQERKALISSAIPNRIAYFDVERVLDWAERTYPNWFAQNGQATQSLDVYRYRSYANGHHLGVQQGSTPRLVYLGPLSNHSLLDLGPLFDWVSQAAP